MQAEKRADTDAIGATLGWVRWIRQQWLLLMFLAGAMIWLRDTAEAVRGVPTTIALLGGEIAAIADGMKRIERALEPKVSAGRDAVLAFPGKRHEIDDGKPGNWTVARLRPARPLREDCQTIAIDAWLIDAEGRWFSVETSLTRVPGLVGDTDIAFGVLIPEDAAPGRAEALVQLTHDCGAHRAAQLAPRLHFRIAG